MASLKDVRMGEACTVSKLGGEVIKKREVTNILIVVTRYFGGIKLGAGGLIRAYSHSAALVLDAASKVIYTPRQEAILTISYALFNTVERFLQEEQIPYSSTFLENVTLHISIPPEESDAIKNTLSNMTFGTMEWALGDISLTPIPL